MCVCVCVCACMLVGVAGYTPPSNTRLHDIVLQVIKDLCLCVCMCQMNAHVPVTTVFSMSKNIVDI